MSRQTGSAARIRFSRVSQFASPAWLPLCLTSSITSTTVCTRLVDFASSVFSDGLPSRRISSYFALSAAMRLSSAVGSAARSFRRGAAAAFSASSATIAGARSILHALSPTKFVRARSISCHSRIVRSSTVVGLPTTDRQVRLWQSIFIGCSFDNRSAFPLISAAAPRTSTSKWSPGPGLQSSSPRSGPSCRRSCKRTPFP